MTERVPVGEVREGYRYAKTDKGLSIELMMNDPAMDFGNEAQREDYVASIRPLLATFAACTAATIKAITECLVAKDSGGATQIVENTVLTLLSVRETHEALAQRVKRGFPAFPKVTIAQAAPPKKNGKFKPRIVEP